MIKYIGSKRRLVPVLTAIAASNRARSALDLFSGTSRVAIGFKQAGLEVTAVDSASYAYVLAQAYVATDASVVDTVELEGAVSSLNALSRGLDATADRASAGYVTEVFCEQARYFHPDNGRRIDAIRDEIERIWSDSALYPVLLTSLLEAADRVDSTTGVQMAYLKSWAPRALQPLVLRAPTLTAGPGAALCGDAGSLASTLGHFDVAYLDPPYNQHRYLANYHVWETIVRWDAPEHYGIACKRVDCRSEERASPYNRRATMPAALAATIDAVDADLVIVSYNDESWLSVGELVEMCRGASREVAVLAIEQPRYVGARIGIHNPAGEKVGAVSHLHNTELVAIAGKRGDLHRAVAAGLDAAAAAGLVSRQVVPEPAGPGAR